MPLTCECALGCSMGPHVPVISDSILYISYRNSFILKLALVVDPINLWMVDSLPVLHVITFLV